MILGWPIARHVRPRDQRDIDLRYCQSGMFGFVRAILRLVSSLRTAKFGFVRAILLSGRHVPTANSAALASFARFSAR